MARIPCAPTVMRWSGKGAVCAWIRAQSWSCGGIFVRVDAVLVVPRVGAGDQVCEPLAHCVDPRQV